MNAHHLPQFSLRYSIQKLSDGWTVYDHCDRHYLDRGLDYEDAQGLAASLEHDEPWPVDDEAIYDAAARADDLHQAMKEAAL